MKKLRFIILILSIFALNSVMSAEKAPIKHNYVYSDTTITEFDKISIVNAINIVYTQSESQSGKVRIYAPEGNDIISLTSKNGLLSVKYGKGYRRDFGVIIVYVYSKELNKVMCSVGANFKAEGLVSGKTLTLKVAHQSQIRMNNLVYDEVKAKRGIGFGDIILSGEVKKASYSIIGRGEINAENLVADDVNCKIFGLGDIGCHVNKEISVRRLGRGAAYCKGDLKISGKNKSIREMPSNGKLQ